MTARRGLVCTALLSLLLTLILAGGVLGNHRTQLFGNELAGRHHDPFTVMAQYEDGHVPPPYLQPATDLAGIALARMLGPLDAYNLLVLISLPLTAIVAFLHARHLTGSTLGAIVAALLYALSPFHLAHAAYHVHIAQVQWLPLLFLTLWRLIEQPSLGRAAAVSGSLLLVGAASLYFGFLTAVMSVPAMLAYAAWRVPADTARSRALLWGAAAIAASAGCVAIAVWLTSPTVFANWSGLGFGAEALDQHSARWWSYLLPAASHPSLGPLSVRIWRSAGIDVGLLEQQVSLGIGVIALAAVQIAQAWRPTPARDERWVMPLTLIAAVAVILSLAPVLAIGPLNVPTPSQLLYAVAPMFRAYARFGAVVSLMVTTLAGGGFALLVADRAGWGRALAIVLLGLAVFEYFPGGPLSRDVLPTAAHRWLAGQQRVNAFDCIAPTPGRTAGVAHLMGAGVTFPAAPLDDCVEPGFSGKLAAFGITHLLIRRDSAAGQWLADGGSFNGVRMVHAAADGAVFEVTAPRPPVYVTEAAGFYPREFFRADSWRWMGRLGTLMLINTSASPVHGTFDLDLEPFMRARQVRIRVDSGPVVTVTAGSRLTHTVGPLTLSAGLHTVALESDDVSTPPPTGGMTADMRQLSLRLRGWDWRPAAP